MTLKQLKKSIPLFFITKKNLLVVFFLMIVSIAFSQQKEITGKVIGQDGEPLIGVSVIIQGTVKGTETDFDGNYKINASSSTVLIFSYIGFKTKNIIVGNKTIINTTLEDDSQALDEVVIVGYGTQKKSDVTGAVGQVKSKELTRVTTTNPTDALQGRVAGVTVTASSGSPGSVADILIRGIGSFGNNRPLFIVDGVQADPYFIDPSNIDSIEVLKDAASAAIYGTRAANGVIIISTKKGKKGKITVNIEQSYSFNTQRKKINLLDANGYVQVHRQMYENAGEPLKNYITNPSNINSNWVDATHRDGSLNILNARVSGASDKLNFSLGGNYANETGLLIGSEFQKRGIFANASFKDEKLTVTGAFNYSETNRRTHQFSLRETFQISPLIPIYDPSKESGFGYRDGDIPNHRNPVGEDFFNEGSTRLKYFLANVGVKYELFKNLTLGANYSISNLSNFTNNFHKPFKITDGNGAELDRFFFLSEYDSNFRRNNQEYTINYKFETDNHNLEVLAGYQRINEPFRENNTQAEGWKISDTDLDGNGDLDDKEPVALADENFKTLNAFRVAGATFSGTGTNATYALVSQFGRINYAFKDRYLFQTSVRRDGSSKFGKNSKYGIFPSFALGWKLTEESFMKDQNFFDFLKLRYSWGQAGNDSALNYYAHQALISQGPNSWDGGYVFGTPQASSTGSIARDLENPDLQWETNISSNIGIDYSILNRKIKGSINYYNTQTKDLLIVKEVAPSSGVRNPVVNVGEFENNGLEFELGYNDTFNEVKFSAFATFSTLNSEVTKLGRADQILKGNGLLFGADHFVNQTKVGYEPGAYFLPVADGIFQSQAEIDQHDPNGTLQPDAKPGDIRFIDQNNDGILDDKDETYQGSALPSYEYSLNLTADYRGIDFNIFFQGVGGNKIYNGNRFQSLGLDTGRNFEADALNAWTPSNTNTDIPRAVLGDPNGNNRASTRFLEKGDYLRIKTIQLGYSLPKSILENINVSKLRFFVTGQNLFTFTNYSGLDPEVAGSILSRGIDRALYPKFKSVILGAQLQF
ncbi:TonB-dependent starch-binding outer membrane protein SusC [Tenacibaculum sp. 190524A02b]|uniref:TonB-dependent starch-binding outer membrane protein SusC n=2 Tax=Tenacibaculum vairaonense TaxID=3137860 RepID=A0ABP1FEA4_9FLAO